MRIGIEGTGYVGLVTGACFATNPDRHVICMDVDKKKIEMLNNGEIPIYEPGLAEIVREGQKRGNLEFTTDPRYVFENSEINFSCVGTPPNPDGSPDLQYVEQVARNAGRYMQSPLILVDKSTVPVGTGRKVESWIKEEQEKRGVDIPYSVVSCPEFLAEGVAVRDFMGPSRVVVGSDSEEALKTMDKLFKPFVRNGSPILPMGLEDAELVKYASNVMLAARLSLVNELALFADAYREQTGHRIDITNVMPAVGADPRIGSKFLYPGTGWGGSCFPKDTDGFTDQSKMAGLDLAVAQATRISNERHKQYLMNRVISSYDDIEGKTFGIWGLAFKAKTDDIRESIAIPFIRRLVDKDAKVRCYDPQAMENVRELFGDKIEYPADKYEAIRGADGAIILTEWEDFRTPDIEHMHHLMKTHKVFDLRNLLRGEIESRLKNIGFDYHGVGR